MADSKGGQSTHLPRWKESTERNTSFDPEKIIASKQVTPKVIKLVEPASFLPSARSSGYVDPEERRGPDAGPPLKGPLENPEDKIKAIVEFFQSAPQESTERALREVGPETIAALFRIASETAGSVSPGPDVSKAADAAPSLAPRPADAPPLWAERQPGWNKTGMKSSCFLWIKLHFGNKDPERWDPMGLKVEHLRYDMPLYAAFSTWVKTHPEDDFDPGARRKVVRYSDPQEAVNRLREQKRASDARLRKAR